MLDLVDITESIDNSILSSDKGNLSSVNGIYKFMLPPKPSFPSLVIIPFNEDISYYPSKYMQIDRRFNIKSFDFRYNKRQARENSIEILEDVKQEFETDFDLTQNVKYIDMVGANVSNSRPINDKFLASSQLEFTVSSFDKFNNLSYSDFSSINKAVSSKELKDKLVDILVQDNEVNFNIGQITDVSSDATMNTPALIVDMGNESYTYNYNNFSLSEHNVSVLILTEYYFEQEAFEYSIDVLEGVKKTIRENYNLDGLAHYVRINDVEFDVDRLSANSDFFQFTNLNLSIFVKEI